jgi:23S rRNA pseudouridine1911/1915/1917 synthase
VEKRDRSKRIPKEQMKTSCLRVEQETELMKFLLEQLPSKTRNNIKSLLLHHQVLVDGNAVSQYNHPLRVGQEVMINWSLVRDDENAKGIKILYEDAYVIVIDKPVGLLSMASDKEKINTAYHQLTDYVRRDNPDNRIFIVHRLDRDTSGVMLFAKNEEVKRILQDSWKEMVIDRAYVAVVEGKMDKGEGEIRSWLKETKTRLMYASSQPGEGIEAISHYKVLRSSDAYSLLEIRLSTGRKNQIRVHMQELGHSIVGDKKYGAHSNPLGRLGLHAHILSFCHPVSRQIMRFETEVPKNFNRLLK